MTDTYRILIIILLAFGIGFGIGYVLPKSVNVNDFERVYKVGYETGVHQCVQLKLWREEE